jgi:DNA-binding IclR family transcriptional regulator
MHAGEPDPAAPPYPIESVDRTLLLLTLLGQRSELRLSEVREHLGIGQSTAHRLLAMLVYRGFAVQDPASRAYRMGPALAAIGSAGTGDPASRLARRARPVLEWLAAQSGETAHLGVLDGLDVRYVDVVESTAPLRVTGRVGRTTPAHATSLGKSMLAALDERHVRDLYAVGELRQATPRTIADLDSLLRELARTRQRGWARNRGEMEQGVCSVGMRLALPAGEGAAALSVATPAARSGTAVEEFHVELLRTACDRLTST